MKKLVLLLSAFSFATAFAQVQFDKSIQLTGGGTDAKVTGIQNVSANTDAASKIYVDTAISARTGWTLNGSYLYENGSNVGIGISTPLAHLQLGGIYSTFQMGSSATASDNFHWVNENNGTNRSLRLYNGNAGAGSQVLTITNAGNVGIGTTNPLSGLHIANKGAVGNVALKITESTHVGIELRSSGNNAEFIDFTPNSTNDAGIGTPDFGGRLGYNEIGTNAFAFTGGNVGIGTTNPGGQLQLSLDQGRKPSTNTWTTVSDARLKNIEGVYTKGLKEILQLQPITYHYKNAGERKFPAEVLRTLNVGYSAQEVQKVFPEAVAADADGYLSFNMHAILVAYTNAIKEQQEMIKTLQEKNNQLEEKLISNSEEIAQIKAMLKLSAKK